MHRICDAVQKIDYAEEVYKTPALQPNIEGKIDYNGSCNDSDHQPGFEFTPASSGAFNNVAHNRVIQGIKDSSSDHNCRNCRELRG